MWKERVSRKANGANLLPLGNAVSLFHRDAPWFHVHENAELAVPMVDGDVVTQPDRVHALWKLCLHNVFVTISVFRNIVCRIDHNAARRRKNWHSVREPVFFLESVPSI